MIGIIGWGVYIPRYRLGGEQFSAAWGGGKSGSRAVANHDEDTITMAGEAALECLEGHDPLEVDRLYFASASMPYLEHQNAAIIAAVTDLRSDVMTCDFSGSVRASTHALRAAYDAVKADEAMKVMVAAADIRPARPGDPLERNLGDGAAALLVGRGEPVARILGFFSTSRMFLDYWRRAKDPYLQSGDPKFITDMGIMKLLPEAVSELLEAMDLAKEETAKVVFYAHDLKERKALQKALGFPASAYLEQDPQVVTGDTGSAQVFISLLAALEQSKPGDKIILANFGSGADACLLEVTDRIAEFKTSLARQLAAGRTLASYARYLLFREMLPREEVNVWNSAAVQWREEKPNLRRLAQKCKACAAVQFPLRYKCWNCGSEDFETYKLSRRGKVFTFTLDSLPPNPDPPTPMVTVDLEGGGRVYAQMTDVDPREVKIGMEVEMVFRKLHEGGGWNTYFWKFRPVRD